MSTPFPILRRASGAGVAAASILAGALVGAGCAGLDGELNLAPVYSSHSAAGNVREVEALGGVVLTGNDGVTGQRRYWAFRPIVSSRLDEKDDPFTWMLPPFGFSKVNSDLDYRVTQLQPFFRYSREREPSGFVKWSLLILPTFYTATHEDRRTQVMVFPFFGFLEGFVSLDRGTFFLFPLWIRFERYGRTTDHVLWPFFSLSRGTGGRAFRIWPLVSHNKWDGRYDRWSFLWPFFYYQRNDLQFPREQHQVAWMVWPLVGHARRGPATETTVLWPLFGRTRDPESGFWAWDGPWPLVRFQGGDPDRPVRKRVWPLFSYYKGDGLTSRWWAWPLVNRRHEEYATGTKDALNVFPFWRGYERHYRAAGRIAPGPERTQRGRKLWPLGRTHSVTTGGRRTESDLTVIDLNPAQDLRFVRDNYSWLWELYTRRAKGEELRTRSWLGVWRREKDADEDRRSLSVLWSARDYERAGRATRERSWLFGLVRYRSVEGGGFSLLPPAFPGPGWPIARTPASKAPRAATASGPVMGPVMGPAAASMAGRPPVSGLER